MAFFRGVLAAYKWPNNKKIKWKAVLASLVSF